MEIPIPSERRPLPKYTSIDLENDVPEIFSTSLNPNLGDPDLTFFYSNRGPPFYNYKMRTSPPPSYLSSSTRSPPISPTISMKSLPTKDRRRGWMLLFFVSLVVCPLLILVLFRLIPQMAGSPLQVK